VGFQSALDSTVVHGWNYYWKSTHLPELADELIDVIAGHAFSCSSPRSYVAMFHLKGAVSRVAEGGTAFGNRQASHAITLDAVWRPGEDFGHPDTAWTNRFFAALGRFREGVYVNFLGGDEAPDRVREAYGGAVYDRLVDVKTTYDPDNVFHHNQNIRPRASDEVGGSDGGGRTAADSASRSPGAAGGVSGDHLKGAGRR
jgi:FAD/FMN-containing dehydrogenase